MKNIDRYLSLKNQYQNSLVLIKTGNFYYTYLEDSIILNYLFNYQVQNNRVGFPLSVIDKIVEELKNNNISIVINDKDNTKYQNVGSNYQDIKIKAKEVYDKKKEIEDLIDKIRYKIDKYYFNYKLIKDFVDEL